VTPSVPEDDEIILVVPDGELPRGVSVEIITAEELQTEAGSMTFIPTASFTVFTVGLVLEPNASAHGSRNSSSARRRTSSQAVPDDSPASTRRARFSISAAQAASTFG